jgi:hypothetical protein
MNASIGSLVFSIPAGAGAPALATAETATGNPAQAKHRRSLCRSDRRPAERGVDGGDRPGRAYGIRGFGALGGAPVRSDGDGGLLAGSDAAQMDLLTDIVALAMQVQEAFRDRPVPAGESGNSDRVRQFARSAPGGL